jgi:hypothetical protein
MSKHSITVTAPRTVSLKVIYDLIITGCEGGDTRIWARGGDVHLPEDPDTSWLGTPEENDFDLEKDGSLSYPFYAAALCGGYTEFIHHYDDSNEVLRLDMEAIKKGLQLMAEHHPRQFEAGVSQNGMMDAITGDIFLQFCLLGEHVYG